MHGIRCERRTARLITGFSVNGRDGLCSPWVQGIALPPVRGAQPRDKVESLA